MRIALLEKENILYLSYTKYLSLFSIKIQNLIGHVLRVYLLLFD